MTVLAEGGGVIVDVPGGWAVVIAALLALVGATAVARLNRTARLERENRQLWWVCKRLLHTLYVHGIEPDDELVELINGKDTT